jgi:hypothetical protein
VLAPGVSLKKLAIPSSEVRDLYDPDGELGRRVSRFVSNVAGGSKEVLAVVGGYGLGKTHVLKYLTYVGRSAGLRVAFIPSPGRGMLDLYSHLVELLIDDVDVQRVSNPALKHALALLNGSGVPPEDLAYVKGWLLGYSIPSRVRYRLGLMGSIRERNVVDFLVEFVNSVIDRAGGLIIALDEVETILNLPRAQRFSYSEGLRELIDSLPPGVGIALAMTPACWDEVMTLNPALFRRLASGVLYLRPLRREQVKDFVSHHFGDLHGLLENEVYSYVFELTNGVHGEVLKYVSILLEEVVYGGARPPLGLDEARRILASYV